MLHMHLKVMDTHLFSTFHAAVSDILTTGKFRNEPFAKSFSDWRVEKEDAPKQALEDLYEYIQKLTESLETRSKGDFNSQFNQETKDVFDFDFMIGLSNEKDKNKVKTKLKEHGTDSLKKLMKRESPNGHSYEKEAALIRQYNEFKQFSYSLLEPSNDKDIDQLNIKNNALVESCVCSKCHQRIKIRDVPNMWKQCIKTQILDLRMHLGHTQQ